MAVMRRGVLPGKNCRILRFMQVRCTFDELVPVGQLKLHPKNRNTHPKKQIERLGEILHYQGWRYPVKVSKRSGLVTSGHGRIAAAIWNGWKEVPVNFQDYESDEQEFADLTADNAIALWAEIDLDGIREDLGGFQNLNVDLLGLDGFTIENEVEGECDPDEVPEVRQSTVSLGDLFALGNHRLLCGDSTKAEAVAGLMAGEVADLVFTDPPYGVGYVGKTADAMEIKNDKLDEGELLRFLNAAFEAWPLKEGGAFYVCAPPGRPELIFRQALGLNLRECIVWVKQQFVMGRQDYHWRHESILYGWRAGAAHYFCDDRTQDTVWEIDRPRVNLEHPTMKPIEIMEKAIRNSSKDGERVFDGFGGSGSTLIACEKSRRKCFTIELDPQYAQVIIDRWEKFTGRKAEKIGSAS